MEYKDDMEEKYYRQIRKNWDRIAKPLDGMGIFEHITAKIGQLQQTDMPVTDKNIVVVLCADNGMGTTCRAVRRVMPAIMPSPLHGSR